MSRPKWNNFYFAFPATFTFSLVCVAIMLLRDWMGAEINPKTGLASGPGMSMMIKNFYSPMWDFWNPKTWLQWLDYRFVTHALGHGNWAHLKGNLIFLLPIAMQVEMHYKARVILPLMFITALSTGILQFIFVGTPLVGASGIVFLMIALSCYADNDAKRVPIDGTMVALMFVAFELYNMFFGADSVSQFAHLMGAGIGIAYGWFLQTHPNTKAKVVKD